MGTLFNFGNWVNLMKKVLNTAIHTNIIPSIYMYIKLW